MKERGMSRRGAGETLTRGSSLLQPFDFFEDLLAPFGSLGAGGRGWMPAVNIEENDEAYLVAAELPGLKPEEVDITVENNILTLSGERKWEVEEGKASNRQLHRVERGYGRFSRSFALPRSVDSDKVKARFDNGVLQITVPKAEGARPRRIQIS
jgi:HSP20 family protein